MLYNLKLGFGTQGNLHVHKCTFLHGSLLGLGWQKSRVMSLSAAGQVSMLFSLPPHV